MSQDFITVEINERYIKACEAYSQKNMFRIKTLGIDKTVPGIFESPNDQIIEQQGIILGNLCDRLKINNDNANVIIPDSQSFSQITEMPLLQEKELLSAIRYQADEFIPMPIDEASLDIEILKEDKKNNKATILIVASPKSVVETVEKVVAAAKLAPHVLENELSVIGRYLSQWWNIPGAGTILVNIGEQTTSLYLYNPTEKLIIATRTVKIGLGLFARDLKVNLNLEESKAIDLLSNSGIEGDSGNQITNIVKPLLMEIGREIQQFAIFSQQKFKINIDKIITYNNDVNIRGLTKKIQEMLNLPTTTMPMQNLVVKNTLSETFGNKLSNHFSLIAASYYEED